MEPILLITGDGASPTDRRPLSLPTRSGTSIDSTTQSTLLLHPERFDGSGYVLIAPGCDRPEALLAWCLDRHPSCLVVGSSGGGHDLDVPLTALRRQGCAVFGPGSQGVLDDGLGLTVSWSPAVRPGFRLDGGVALISQGGALAFSIYDMALGAGVRFRRVVSLGTWQNDDGLIACLENSMADSAVKLIVLCLEGLGDGRRLMELAAQSLRHGVPVLLLRSGSSPGQDQRAQQRHPQGRWTDDATWTAVAQRYGLILLSDVSQLVAFAKLYGGPWRPQGNRTACLASSEGLALIQSDSCFQAQLPLPPFDDETAKRLASLLPRRIDPINPINGTVAILRDNRLLGQLLETLQASKNHDMILVTLGALGPDDAHSVAAPLLAAHRQGPKPLALCCLSDALKLGGLFEKLAHAGLPIYSSPAQAANAMALLSRVARPIQPAPPSPKPSSPPRIDRLPAQPDEQDAMNLVADYGLSLVPGRLCHNLSEAMDAADELGFPLALKVVSPTFFNKQQARAVVLSIRTLEELRNAYGRVLERVSRLHPDVPVRGVLVQSMVTDGVECMIGLKRDPLFGPVVAVALGGAYYAMTRDIVLRPAPLLSLSDAKTMIGSLRGAPLITGAWGGVPLAADALARGLVALSHMGDAEPDLQLLDINPIFVRPSGAEIADAFLRRVERSRS